MSVKFTLGEPAIIAQADPSIREWGPYQFPNIELLDDGRLHCGYHVAEDSARGYGVMPGQAVSADGGKTWKPFPEADYAGITLPNGDRIRVISKKAEVLDPTEIPKNLQCETLCNAGRVQLYDPDDFPRCYDGYYLTRKKAGTEEWVEERHDIHIPHASRVFRHNMDNLLSYLGFSRLRLGPDGVLWGILYQYTYLEGRGAMAAIFVTSDDNGKHWDYKSTIYYKYKPNREDFYWATRTGFTEPDIAFLPNGDIFCVLRTDDCFHVGPSYCCYSSDNGDSWTEPVRFDDLGVWPCPMTLKNGVTVVGYGRPGLYLRATSDPAGKNWEDRITIVEPNKVVEDTYSYCDIVPLSDDSFYLVYSDFNIPNQDGKPCKTILGRHVTTKIEP